ncbi:MAG: hypothetical protein RLZZ528_1315 [Pseudomonadota bacterium]|jgi:hypothetical protein
MWVRTAYFMGGERSMQGPPERVMPPALAGGIFGWVVLGVKY